MGEMIATATPKVDEAKAAAAAVEAAGKPLTDLDADGLKTFATPAAVQEAVEKASDALKEKSAEARKLVTEKVQEVTKVKPQTGATGEAGRQLLQMRQQLAAADAAAKKVLQDVKGKCNSLVEDLMAKSATAMRKDATARNITTDKMF